MNNINKQFAIDLGCKLNDLKNNLFIHGSANEETSAEACANGLILLHKGNLYMRMDNKDLLTKLEDKYQTRKSDWFFEPSNIHQLESILDEYGYFISEWKLYFLPIDDTMHEIDTTNLVYYYDEEIKQFQNDQRFDECFLYDEKHPDRIGVAYVEDGEILAMCGSNQTGTHIFEIGINTLPGNEGKGIAPSLVKATMNEVRKISNNNCIPVYGTQFSHTHSLNVAIRSGFKIGWTQINILKKERD